MTHKADPLHLLIILLGFSLVLSSTAVPASRSLLSNREESSSSTSTQTTLVQDLEEMRNGEEMIEGRMDLASADYPGTGANNRHDPRPPGRA